MGSQNSRCWLFRVGVLAVVCGTLLHLPMFAAARDMDYHMAGMETGTTMTVAMLLLVAGSALTLAGLLTPRRGAAAPDVTVVDGDTDTAPARRARSTLIGAMILAVAIDAQKPFTFTFIIPAVTDEYGLSAPGVPGASAVPVAVLPLAGIAGTTIGSLVWGYLGDRIGRQASIVYAAVLFVGTSVCGAMPTFTGNVIMCFAMGLAAGGMLPVIFTLLAETIPRRIRGRVMVLVGGLGAALGFLLASWSATVLMPLLGWRALWLIGAPTGLLLLAVCRFVPESPRFLLLHGKHEQALSILHRFGMRLAPATHPDPGGSASTLLLAPRLRAATAALLTCGIAWGLANFGFLVWLPQALTTSGVAIGTVTTTLAQSALVSLPGVIAVAWLYARWGNHRTVTAAAALTALTLLAFAALTPAIIGSTTVLLISTVLLLLAIYALHAAIIPYSAELFPTAIRARGTALVAGATKLGGIAALTLTTAGITPPGITASALLAALPMLAGMTLLWTVPGRVGSLRARGARLGGDQSR
ncbi:MFS transporter [Haloechinothrix sp. LS1_15]|uniref:MFS transporter n=1 Tax=Haloechinothrix sp. LS1_15 TaxID=2652248 RepID=UPI00294631B2|nr:MFS transporter [Haloechinothrix sp. LS1_15]MDV6014721.1 MFS transporter [Haloechinothrix sp. LS1_15]